MDKTIRGIHHFWHSAQFGKAATAINTIMGCLSLQPVEYDPHSQG